MLLYGNAERSIVELAHRLAAGESIDAITDVRGTVFTRKAIPEGWVEIDSTHLDTPGALNPPIDPYAMSPAKNAQAPAKGLAESEEALNRRAAGSAHLPRGTPVASEHLEATASARPAAPSEAAASSSAQPC